MNAVRSKKSRKTPCSATKRQKAKELIIHYTDVKKEKKIATYKLGYAKYYMLYSRLVFALRMVKTKEIGEGCETVH